MSLAQGPIKVGMSMPSVHHLNWVLCDRAVPPPGDALPDHEIGIRVLEAIERRAKVFRGNDKPPYELSIWLSPLPIPGQEIHMLVRVEEIDPRREQERKASSRRGVSIRGASNSAN